MTITFRNALDIGCRIDRYEVEAVIGHGGFGISYRAVDNESGERVALKEYLPTELATREADDSVYPLSESHLDNFQWGLERFLDEVRLLAGFHHPNIVRVQRAFEGNGTAYMVMDYEEGETLATCLKREGTLAGEALTVMTMALLEGLELVHESGFIHRDIKPSNIYLRHDGSPVLLDFGSARQALKGKTRTLTALVSAGYAPLEQYFSRSDLQGPWTDIYGLGATLYHAISGEPPIDAVERSRGVLGSTQDILPPAAEVAERDYSPCLLAAVDHALRMDDKDRPRGVGEWRKELAGEIPVPEAPVTTLATPETRTPTVRALRPNDGKVTTPSRRIGFMGASAVLVVAIGSLGWWQWSGMGETPKDDGIESTSKVTEHRADEQVATLRGSLANANATAESSRERIEELIAKLEKLEAAPENESNDKPTPQPATRDDQLLAGKQHALISELRLALDAANTESDEGRQQVGELAARVRMLEASQQAKNVEASTRRQEIDGLLAAAADHFSRLRLTTPVGENAHERYRQVLELEDDNADAMLGLEQIVEKYIELAKLAQHNDQFKKAEDYLDRASAVLPTYAALATAREELAETQLVRKPRNRTTESKHPDLQSLDEENLVELEADTPENDANPESQYRARSPDAIEVSKPKPLRVAVLPFATNLALEGRGFVIARAELNEFIHEFVEDQKDLELVYSYYSQEGDPVPVAIPIAGVDSVWPDGLFDRTPNQLQVYAVSNDLDADIALTYFHVKRLSGWYGIDLFKLTVFLFDVKNKRLYQRGTDENNFKGATKQVFEELIRARNSSLGTNSSSPPTSANAVAAGLSSQLTTEVPISAPLDSFPKTVTADARSAGDSGSFSVAISSGT